MMEKEKWQKKKITISRNNIISTQNSNMPNEHWPFIQPKWICFMISNKKFSSCLDLILFHFCCCCCLALRPTNTDIKKTWKSLTFTRHFYLYANFSWEITLCKNLLFFANKKTKQKEHIYFLPHLKSRKLLFSLPHLFYSCFIFFL